MGPPGSGKGTQAVHIASTKGVKSISSGDLFRENLSMNTDLGKLAKSFMDKGEYVPDKITIDMVMGWIDNPEHSAGFVLDGFPRTLAQAEALEERLADKGGVDRVIFFNVPEGVLVSRLSSRFICRSCHTPYNDISSPPLAVGKCDLCHGELYQRDDDQADVVRNRLSVYMRETEPVVDHFRQMGKLFEIDASQKIEDVRGLLEKAIR